jgi:hypothetical protein
MLHVDAIKYRLEAEHCFSIARAVEDPGVRRQLLDAALYWFHLAEETENRPNLTNVASRKHAYFESPGRESHH